MKTILVIQVICKNSNHNSQRRLRSGRVQQGQFLEETLHKMLNAVLIFVLMVLFAFLVFELRLHTGAFLLFPVPQHIVI